MKTLDMHDVLVALRAEFNNRPIDGSGTLEASVRARCEEYGIRVTDVLATHGPDGWRVDVRVEPEPGEILIQIVSHPVNRVVRYHELEAMPIADEALFPPGPGDHTTKWLNLLEDLYDEHLPVRCELDALYVEGMHRMVPIVRVWLTHTSRTSTTFEMDPGGL